jgi:hypothetical protein
MLKNIIHIILGIIATATALGVVLHDTQLDKAMTMAIALPISTIGYVGADAALKASDGHVHVERVSLAKMSGLRSAHPCINPRDNTLHMKKQSKIAFLGPDTASTLWPSV